MDRQMVKVTIGKNGKKSVTGTQTSGDLCKKIASELLVSCLWVVLVTLLRSGGKDMKLSQQYPQDFGREVANLHLGYMSSDPWDSVICNILVYFTSLSESRFLCASHRRLITILIMVSFELWVDKQKHQKPQQEHDKGELRFWCFCF